MPLPNRAASPPHAPHHGPPTLNPTGNLLATAGGDLVYLDFGMMSEMPQGARYAVIAHIVHLVNRDYRAMTRDYYALDFIDPSIDTSPIAPALAAFFDDVLTASVSSLNFKALVDGLGEVLFRYPFRVPPYYALILRSLTVLEGLALSSDPDYKLLAQAYPYVARRLLTDPAPELRCFGGVILGKVGVEGKKGGVDGGNAVLMSARQVGEWQVGSGVHAQGEAAAAVHQSTVAPCSDHWPPLACLM